MLEIGEKKVRYWEYLKETTSGFKGQGIDVGDIMESLENMDAHHVTFMDVSRLEKLATKIQTRIDNHHL